MPPPPPASVPTRVPPRIRFITACPITAMSAEWQGDRSRARRGCCRCSVARGEPTLRSRQVAGSVPTNDCCRTRCSRAQEKRTSQTSLRVRKRPVALPRAQAPTSMRSPSGVELRGFGQQIQQHLLYLALVGVNHPQGARRPCARAGSVVRGYEHERNRQSDCVEPLGIGPPAAAPSASGSMPCGSLRR